FARILQQLGDDNLGASLFFSTFTQSAAVGNKTGYALSGTVLILIDSANARIESGAQINRNTSNPAASQDVSVTARADIQTMNLVGNFPQILDVAQGQAEQKRQLSNSGAAGGWGGSFSSIVYVATTQAVIESGALVNAHDLLVDGETLNWNIS